ncbi:MAG: hypothetical protein FWD59_06015 [Micrococcales bacterium]|nr:hypothetical protein [Micrococcales bacterium]
MPAATTTIRIPRTTRDDLNEIARARGVSVARLISDQVAAWQRDEWFRQERKSGRTLSADALAEQELLEATDDNWD